MMNYCFSLREISYFKFINYWFSLRENFLLTWEYFLKIIICFDYYQFWFLEFLKYKKINELKKWVSEIKFKRLKLRIIIIIEN